MRVGYLRVSSTDQNTVRQLDGIEVERIFEDKVSGKDADRPKLAEICLLYTSDAADERSSVDLGGRRIIKKKTKQGNGTRE